MSPLLHHAISFSGSSLRAIEWHRRASLSRPSRLRAAPLLVHALPGFEPLRPGGVPGGGGAPAPSPSRPSDGVSALSAAGATAPANVAPHFAHMLEPSGSFVPHKGQSKGSRG